MVCDRMLKPQAGHAAQEAGIHVWIRYATNDCRVLLEYFLRLEGNTNGTFHWNLNNDLSLFANNPGGNLPDDTDSRKFENQLLVNRPACKLCLVIL